MGRDHAWTFLFQDKMISNASDGSNDPADIDQSDEKNYKNAHQNKKCIMKKVLVSLN